MIGDSLTFNASLGENKLFLEHFDVMYFSTEDDLKLETGDNFIMLKTTPFGHKVKKLNPLSKNFKKINEEKEKNEPKEKEGKGKNKSKEI